MTVLNGEEGLEYEICVMESNWNICRNLNIYDVFWTSQLQMRQSAVGR